MQTLDFAMHKAFAVMLPVYNTDWVCILTNGVQNVSDSLLELIITLTWLDTCLIWSALAQTSSTWPLIIKQVGCNRNSLERPKRYWTCSGSMVGCYGGIDGCRQVLLGCYGE